MWGGTPPKKHPKGPPFGNFGKFFQSSKKSPKIKKSQGSPLWIFWEIFINLKKISNNGLLLKKNKIFSQDHKPSAQETQKTGDTGATAVNTFLSVVVD